MHHAGSDKTEIHFLGSLIVGYGADGVVGISLGDIVIIDIRIGDHGLIDLVEVDHEFLKVFGIGIRSEGRLFSRTDFGDALVGTVDQSLKNLFFIVHPFVDHYLNPALGDFK